MSSDTVAVLGAGSWGTALASLLAKNGKRVFLWGRDKTHLEEIATTRLNQRYLDGAKLPDTLATEADLSVLLKNCSQFLLVVPSHAFSDLIRQLAEDLSTHTENKKVTLIWGTKGLAPGSGQLLSGVVHAQFENRADYGIVSGPSFAKEVALGLPAALTVAANDEHVASSVAAWFRNDKTRVYTNADLAGVQLGGAIKNVMAIATGVSDGLGLGANARAALITRGLSEMMRLGVALGGKAETFMGLTGVGDLILTCTDDQSRNRRVGLGLGEGKSLQQVLDNIGQEAEGVITAKTLFQMSERLKLDMPITTQVYRVLFEGLEPSKAVEILLSREPKSE